MNNKKSSKKNRPPTKNNNKKASLPLPIVSLREQERKLLKEMSNGKRLNVNGYSDYNKIPRSTTRTRLKKLDRLGLVDDKETCKTITKRGLIYLENTNQIEKEGVGSSRQEGRKNQLSTHWNRFELLIEDKQKFRKESLERLNHKGIKENKLHNLHQIFITLDDAKIIINPKRIYIDLYEVLTEDTEESDMKCLNRAVEYAEKLKSFGLKTSGVMVEKGHWARIESNLADFLYKNVDEKYELILEDGSKFFIDCSKVLEDETDNKIVRKNIDKALNKIGIGDIDFDDIDKIKESIGSIARFEAIKSVKNNTEMSRVSLMLNSITKQISDINETNKDTALGLNALTNFTKSQLPKIKEEKIENDFKYDGYLG